ncbi:MAG: glycosyltransferase family 2 protein [Candidatus Brocadiia bacterium]
MSSGDEVQPHPDTNPPVTVIIPALNEAEAIGQVVRELRQRYPEYEVLVVDDGSTDDTGEIARQAGARVVRHDWNKGYGAGLRTGCREARGEVVCFFDADGQHHAEDVGRLVAEVGDYDMVVGARTRDCHAPWRRRPGKLVLRWFANFLAGMRIPDLNSGLRAFKREVLLKYLHLMPSGFSFSTTSTFAMLKSDRPVKWVPITVERRVGTSSVSQVRHGLQVLLLMLRLTTLFEPLKVFLPVSGLLVALGLCFFAVYASQGVGLTDATVMLVVSGVIVFMMGLVIDQVAAIRREKHE